MGNTSGDIDFTLNQAERRIADKLGVPSEFVTLNRSAENPNGTILTYAPAEDGPRLTPAQLQTALDDMSKVGIGYTKTSSAPARQNDIPHIVLHSSPETILEALPALGMVRSQG